jgi:hypothetical protein
MLRRSQLLTIKETAKRSVCNTPQRELIHPAGAHWTSTKTNRKDDHREAIDTAFSIHSGGLEVHVQQPKYPAQTAKQRTFVAWRSTETDILGNYITSVGVALSFDSCARRLVYDFSKLDICSSPVVNSDGPRCGVRRYVKISEM